MYPSILRDETFPCALLSVRGSMRPREVVELAQGGGVIARVTIRTDVGEYPYRIGERVIYPTGTFMTTLAGPDIAALAHDGEIVRVHQVAIYSMGRPFQGAMRTLLDARREAKERGDHDGQAFAKLLANSLGGRLAMHIGGWSRDSERDCPGEWGERYESSTTGSPSVRYRYLCGACWRYDPDREGAGPHTSAFAYLTAYGRQMMRQLRDSLPAKSVVSQDTDGLYLLPRAARVLAERGVSAYAAPGRVRSTGSADSGHWYAPRHYRIGSRWVLAGFAPATPPDGALRFAYSSDTPLFGRGDRRAPSVVTRVTRTTSVPTDVDNGVVGEDGWVTPRHLHQPWEG